MQSIAICWKHHKIIHLKWNDSQYIHIHSLMNWVTCACVHFRRWKLFCIIVLIQIMCKCIIKLFGICMMCFHEITMNQYAPPFEIYQCTYTHQLLLCKLLFVYKLFLFISVESYDTHSLWLEFSLRISYDSSKYTCAIRCDIAHTHRHRDTCNFMMNK